MSTAFKGIFFTLWFQGRFIFKFIWACLHLTLLSTAVNLRPETDLLSGDDVYTKVSLYDTYVLLPQTPTSPKLCLQREDGCNLKEHYRIGFCKQHSCWQCKHFMYQPNIHKLTNLNKFEIDRPSGSRENSEKPVTNFALHRCQNKNE